jgi:hypothetical protein
MMRNEANLPGREWARGGKVVRAGAAGPKRAKQSQFRRSGRMGKYLVEKGLWRNEHAEASAKQSQFAPARP